MISIIKKIFPVSKNFNLINLSFLKLKEESGIKKIFKLINESSETNEIRYVGGCVRKILLNEKVDDIDLAVNLKPNEVMSIFKDNNIKFYETGIDHGTITAVIDKSKFEITSLRKDIDTDGRHSKVEFSKSWEEDAKRRDFTINSLYADIEGNLFDPFNGRKDLTIGKIKFIGSPEKRIKEDYLRILRYLRFFLNYSKKNHEVEIIKTIKKNLDGLYKISSERILDEFKKLSKSPGFLNLFNDKFCLEVICLIFPQFKNLDKFKNGNKLVLKNLNNFDFIIIISFMIIDGSDNVEYFLFKFNLSKINQRRILFLNRFFHDKKNKYFFTKKGLRKVLYLNGKQALIDLLDFQIIKSKKDYNKLVKLRNFYEDKEPPLMPIKAKTLIEEYNIPEGKILGLKLKKIEEKWINNDFQITSKEIQKIILD